MSSQVRSVVRIESDQSRTERREAVVEEAALRIAATDGRVVATIMRTPGHDLELVAGFLRAEGLHGSVRQIGADDCTVELPATAFAPRATISSAACGVCGREVIADLEARAEVVRSALTVSSAELAALPGRLRASQAVFEATGGLHAAGLFDAAGRLLAIREDVGRHNAVDKVVGWGTAAGVEFGAAILMLSGRLGFELVHKAVIAGIPIVAAVSAPSSLAIDVAERFGVTAVGFVREGRMTVYSHPARIL